MTIEYETVLYNSGYLLNNEIASWSDVSETYLDNTPSFLTKTIPAQVVVAPSSTPTSIPEGTTTSQVVTVLSTPKNNEQQVSSNIPTATQRISVPTVITGFGNGGAPPTE